MIEREREIELYPMLGVARRTYEKYGFEALVTELMREVREVASAWDKVGEAESADEHNKEYAHTAEELFDLATRCVSMLYLLQELPECPCRELVRTVANQVLSKDHARGYDK